ncbi:MAG: hydrogenase nickel incorporation protein HypB [Myxococcales bacterium]|nr:hydrogenase nickel incorporation protein HypB [Myxococcales bacterium]
MCNTCGCSVTDGNRELAEAPVAKAGLTTVEVLQRLLDANDHEAEHNRSHLDAHGVLAVNLMSSPGSGKTSLLEKTIELLGSKLRFAVIEGDLETENDAERIRRKGVPAVQITTGSACHLDAHMVHRALHGLDLSAVDVLFIENVGNLVCPASFDLGHHLNVTLLATTEGADKPAKYPVMFRAADVVVMTKMDLLPHLDDFDPEEAKRHLRALASPAPVLSCSARGANGIDEWVHWLEGALASHRAMARTRRSAAEAGHAHHHHDHHHGHGHHHHEPRPDVQPGLTSAPAPLEEGRNDS